jgi:hypothetical protein
VQQVEISHHQQTLQSKRKNSVHQQWCHPHCICSRVIHIGVEKSIPSVTPMHREYVWVAWFLLMKHLIGASLGPGCRLQIWNCKLIKPNKSMNKISESKKRQIKR